MTKPLARDLFHPAVAAWLEETFDAPTPAQAEAWPAIRAGRNALIAAPTGSGKTLAAFLAAIDDLVRAGLEEGGLPDETRVLYVSPLKALSHDVEKNLEQPLAGIRAQLERLGLTPPAIRTAVRTGDTPARERQATLRKPPHLFVTTPESLAILLATERGRAMLQHVRAVIVDEIHAVAPVRRGAHLSLSLERLETLVGRHRAEHRERHGAAPARRLQRIGLSATQSPVEEVARFLVGAPAVDAKGTPDCVVVDQGHRRTLDVAVEVPPSPLSAVMSNEEWGDVHDRVAALCREHRTTIVFVNTRRAAERVARQLAERLGEEAVAAHHGSLARETRHEAERRLKAGELRALVATASLELGIDIGDVDLVVQLGVTATIATLLQRVGRSGHGVGRTPKGRIIPTSRDELQQAAALLLALRRGELDRLRIPTTPLDMLAQHLVAACLAEERREDDLFTEARAAWPFRDLCRADFDRVVEMLSEGFATTRGRRSAWLHRDEVHATLRARRGARLAVVTSGGAIPDTADYEVVLEPTGERVGTVNEDFALETMVGDVFQLGNTSWRIVKVESGRMRVEDAKGQPPSIPFWIGEAPARSDELSALVSEIRGVVERRLDEGGEEAARRWLREEIPLPEEGARQLAEYLAAARAALGRLPTADVLVLERFFDEAGATQIVLHAPLGSRVMKAWGLALRKKFCRKFDFELQAQAGEDSLCLSLGPSHSFPLEDAWRYLSSSSVRPTLVQALLASPLFEVRWRWNAGRALAVLRRSGGRRVPPQLLRMRADDLLAQVFPDSVACAENLAGDREIPEHPLVDQTVRDGLEEATDCAALEAVLRAIEADEKELVAVDLAEPSPLAAEVLNARPWAFLDDAPLEERRTRAVQQRRWLSSSEAAELGALDAAVVAGVASEAWPDPRDAEELHEALVMACALEADEVAALDGGGWLDALVAAGRATRVRPTPSGPVLVAAAERLPVVLAAHPDAALDPPIEAPPRRAAERWDEDAARRELVRGRSEISGPATAAEVSERLGLPESDVARAFESLEVEGFVLRGRFRDGVSSTEWWERRLLARARRRTLARLREEIRPVSVATFQRFLLDWQHVSREHRLDGPEGLLAVVGQLAGCEVPAAAWEDEVLPARCERWDPGWLDSLCLTGRVAWQRIGVPGVPRAGGGRRGPALVRTFPLVLAPREALADWHVVAGDEAIEPSPTAARVEAELAARGACFAEDLSRALRLLPAELDAALAELVAAGRVTGDGFANLRRLMGPGRVAKRRRAAPVVAGRWSLTPPRVDPSETVEARTRQLLARWGVVARGLVVSESLAPAWRDCCRVLRRLEVRGEVRGGRFVEGLGGEQYALPGVVAALRAVRARGAMGELVSLCAADPACLVGVAGPTRKLPALQSNRVLLRDGCPVALLEAGRVELLVDGTPGERWALEKALRRSDAAPLERRLPA